MRRRVARVVRIALFAVGAALLAWLPISFGFWITVFTPYPTGMGSGFYIKDGAVNTAVFLDSDTGGQFLFLLHRPPFNQHRAFEGSVLPDLGINQWGIFWSTIPLWLPAVLCLAWPVTSFIIARRRHKRGFPVEVAASSGVGSGPLSRRERVVGVVAKRPGEGGTGAD